jgi:Ca2+-transporting ATPase
MSSLLPFHSLSAIDVLKTLSSSTAGLSSAEVKKRLEKSAEWRVAPPKPTPAVVVFLRQFISPFVALLFVAGCVSLWGGEMIEAGVTFAIVLANALLGFFQEVKADRAFFALQNYLPSMVTVRRDGATQSIAADGIVPGDIVLLRAGQKVIADGRVLEAVNCSVTEASLSGESAPVEKRAEVCDAKAALFERFNIVYAGTAVMTGEATVVVTALGTQSEFGKIATMTTTVVEQETPLTKEIGALSRWLTGLILLIAGVMFVLSLWRGASILSALTLAAALAIAAIPEGLSVTLTVLLAAAMRRMLERGVLVRHLVTTEALGCVDVLCVDKTGTLTTGEMSVATVETLKGAVEKTAVFSSDFGAALLGLSADYRKGGGGAFAGAATFGAIGRYVDEDQGGQAVKAVVPEAALPFDAANRFSACTIAGKTFVMGAPDALMLRSASSADKKSIERHVEEMAKRGLRVLMVGECEGKGVGGRVLTAEAIQSVQLLGFVGIQDPLRPSVPGAIARAAMAGIRTIMMTGDHPETAKTIGAEAFERSNSRVMLGESFAALSQAQRMVAVRDVDIFARMLPEHKLLVVQALHADGLRVAMTGDGVNDAPALKASDVGIAVGAASDVAKEAADMILLDGDFGSIVSAIAEGRTVFANARNVTIFLLALGLGEVFCILGSFLFALPLPLSPLLILWLNVVTDGVPGLFFAFERTDARVMTEPPRRPGDGLVSPTLTKYFSFSAIVLFVVVLSLLVISRVLALPISFIQTAAYLGIGLLGLLFVFVTRSMRVSFLANASARSAVSVGVVIGFFCLLIPFSTVSLRSFFSLIMPSAPMIVVLLLAIMVVLVPLDVVKRKLFKI